MLLFAVAANVLLAGAAPVGLPTQTTVIDEQVLREGPPFRLRTRSNRVAEWTLTGGSSLLVGEGRDGWPFPDFADVILSAPDGSVSLLPVTNSFATDLDAAWDVKGVLWTTHMDFGPLLLRRHGPDGITTITLDVPVPPEGGGQNPRLVDFFLGGDGRLHAVLTILNYDSGEGRFRHLLFWGTQDSEAFPVRYLGETRGLAAIAPLVDREGRLWQLESPSGSPAFSNDLVLVRYDGIGRTEDLVHRATEMDYFPSEASMALLPDGSIVIAARIVKTVSTGSPVYSRLDFFERGESGWNQRTLADRSDGYRGSDGDQYTGAWVQMHADQRGGLHLLFTDIANWHQGGFSRATGGQLRYGYRHPGEPDWAMQTLYSQPGQSQSSNPLHALHLAGVALSPGGSQLHVYGEETRSEAPPQLDSTNVSASWLRRFRIQNPRGSDLSAGAADVVAILLCRPSAPLATPALDLNGDGVLDAGDLRLAL